MTRNGDAVFPGTTTARARWSTHDRVFAISQTDDWEADEKKGSIFTLVEPGDDLNIFTALDEINYRTQIVLIRRHASREAAQNALNARDRELLDAILRQDE